MSAPWPTPMRAVTILIFSGNLTNNDSLPHYVLVYSTLSHKCKRKFLMNSNYLGTKLFLTHFDSATPIGYGWEKKLSAARSKPIAFNSPVLPIARTK